MTIGKTISIISSERGSFWSFIIKNLRSKLYALKKNQSHN